MSDLSLGALEEHAEELAPAQMLDLARAGYCSGLAGGARRARRRAFVRTDARPCARRVLRPPRERARDARDAQQCLERRRRLISAQRPRARQGTRSAPLGGRGVLPRSACIALACRNLSHETVVFP